MPHEEEMRPLRTIYPVVARAVCDAAMDLPPRPDHRRHMEHRSLIIMPRKSKVAEAGVGDKVIAYHLSGLSLQAIANRMREENALDLTVNNIDSYLKRHSKHIEKKREIGLDNRIEWTLDEIRKQLSDTVVEIKGYIAKHEDDPRAVSAFLKVRLDALDKIAKLLGGYPSEHPTVNVQVNNIVSKDAFEKSLKDSEEYFESLVRVGGEHAV